jgi:aromatic ring-opening dioxygenase catalytic subunit (LigB family)
MRLPTYFVSHGGGPWPWMDGPYRRQYDQLEASLSGIVSELGAKPRALLVISGHWEEDRFTVQAAEAPGMVYDYGGFPPHTYQIRYASPGAPDVARRVEALLGAAGIPAARDAQRGYDHGTFVPLYSMYPEADVPVLQLSIRSGYDPEQHLAVGRALAPLRDEGVLILASGLSYHNLRLFGPGAKAPSEAFDAWLAQSLALPSRERTQALEEWDRAPAARVAHPREDHFIPLLVAAGAAESEAAERVYHEQDFMGGVTASSYRFGEVSRKGA